MLPTFVITLREGVEAALKARDDADAEATAKAAADADAAEKAKKAKPPFLEDDDKTDPEMKKAIAKAVEDAVAPETAAEPGGRE